MLILISLAFGTLVSEDLACITAGLLIQRGQISVAFGILACTVGIFVGDVGLWVVGRLFGRAALGWPWMRRRLQHPGAEKMCLWLHRHAAGAIVSSRFLPGTRLPLYVTAGVLKLPVRVFAVWTLVAALLWTPALVLVAAGVGDGINPGTRLCWWSGQRHSTEEPAVFSRRSDARGLHTSEQQVSARVSPTSVVGWAPTLVVVAVILLLLQGGRHLATSSRRARLTDRLARWSRWEFWPMWPFYAPVAVWVAWLSLRHRGLSTMTAANPGMPDGGTVGESKFEILSRLPADCIVPSVLVPAGATADRLSVLEQLIRAHPRYRLQADLFVARHRGALRRVLAADERFQLAIAGNHAQAPCFEMAGT